MVGRFFAFQKSIDDVENLCLNRAVSTLEIIQSLTRAKKRPQTRSHAFGAGMHSEVLASKYHLSIELGRTIHRTTTCRFVQLTISKKTLQVDMRRVNYRGGFKQLQQGVTL